MELTHLFGLIPLLVFLIISLVFYRMGLVHLLLIGYSIALAFMAITNEWEILFFIPILIGGMIGLILFCNAMVKGVWL